MIEWCNQHKHGTCQQAHSGVNTARRYAQHGRTGVRGMARRGGQEDCGTHPRGAPGAHAAGGGSGRPDVAAAVILADAPDSAKSGAGAGKRAGGRPGIPRDAAAARAAASRAGRAGAGRGRVRRHRGPRAAQHLPGGAEQGTGVKITEEQVRYVAALSNLQLSVEEVARLRADLDGILEHMDRLNEIDTSGVEPMAQVLYEAEDTATLRADTPVEPLGNAAAMANRSE